MGVRGGEFDVSYEGGRLTLSNFDVPEPAPFTIAALAIGAATLRWGRCGRAGAV